MSLLEFHYNARKLLRSEDYGGPDQMWQPDNRLICSSSFCLPTYSYPTPNAKIIKHNGTAVRERREHMAYLQWLD